MLGEFLEIDISGLSEIGNGFFNRLALACRANFRTFRYKPFLFLVNYSS